MNRTGIHTRSATFYIQKSTDNLFATSNTRELTKSSTQRSLHKSVECIARLYRDAIRRMGQAQRINKEKVKASHSRSKSLGKGLTKTSFYRIEAHNRAEREYATTCKTLLIKRAERKPPPKIDLKKAKALLEKAKLENAKAITSNMECLEKVYQMRPNKHNAELFSKALRAAKRPKTPAMMKRTSEKFAVKGKKLTKMASPPKGDTEVETDI